jgi:hypothetical protein
VSALSLLAAMVLAVAALLILLLCVPLRMSFRFASDPPKVDISLGWPFGWMPEIRLGGRGRRAREAGAAPARISPSPPRARPGSRLPRALKALPSLLASVVRALRVERLRLHGRFGAGDPALTGQIYGACTPLVFGTAGMRGVDVRLEPDFARACLWAEGLAVLRLRPIALLGPVIRFVWASYGPRR